MRAGSKPKAVRDMLAQTRPPLANRNGRYSQSKGGKGQSGLGEDGNVAQLRQFLAERDNTIAQLLRSQEPSKAAAAWMREARQRGALRAGAAGTAGKGVRPAAASSASEKLSSSQGAR